MAKLLQKKSQRARKEVSLTDLKEKVGRAKSMVMTDYRGLTMTKLQELRATLGVSAEFTVAKNTILAKALNEAGVSSVTPDTFAGPTAVLFAYEDEVGPLKVLTKFSGASNELPRIKGGILDGSILSGDKVKALSKLPSKDQLRGQVVGTLAAPLSGLVSVLNGNIRNLVYALEQVRVQKAA
jgi:large subunit ribosomal protein L10